MSLQIKINADARSNWSMAAMLGCDKINLFCATMKDSKIQSSLESRINELMTKTIVPLDTQTLYVAYELVRLKSAISELDVLIQVANFAKFHNSDFLERVIECLRNHPDIVLIINNVKDKDDKKGERAS